MWGALSPSSLAAPSTFDGHAKAFGDAVEVVQAVVLDEQTPGVLAPARLDADAGTLSLLEPAVEAR